MTEEYGQVVITKVAKRHLYCGYPSPGYDSGCQNQPMGTTNGFRTMTGAAYNTIRYSEATGLNVGIWIGSGPTSTTILPCGTRIGFMFRAKAISPRVHSSAIGRR